LNSNLWYLIGSLWGDPCFCISNGRVYVGVYGEKEFCENFMRSLFDVFGEKGYLYFNRSTGCHVGLIEGSSARLQKIYHHLAQFGPFNKNSWRVPEVLHRGTEEEKAKALRGYFDAEGCAYYDQKRGDRRIEVESKNKRGLLQVQNLLSSFWIISKLYRDRNWWKLRISCQKNVRHFRNLVNFTISDKRTKLEKLVQSYKRNPYRKHPRAIPL